MDPEQARRLRIRANDDQIAASLRENWALLDALCASDADNWTLAQRRAALAFLLGLRAHVLSLEAGITKPLMLMGKEQSDA